MLPAKAAVNMVQYLVAFDTPGAALRFVQRLHMHVQDVATFRDDVHVLVMDGSINGQRERIMQMARESSASMVRARER